MEQKPTLAAPEKTEKAISEARRRFLRQLAGLPLYVAPLVMAVSLSEGQGFPSPPPPPP